MNKTKLKELNFLTGYLMYLKTENILFKPLLSKFNLLKNELQQENRNKNISLMNMGFGRY